MPRISHIPFWRLIGWPLAALLVAAALPLRSAAGQDVWSYVSKDSVSVGDRFALYIVAEHEADAQPLFLPPEAGEAFGDLEIVGMSDIYSRLIEGGAGRRQDSVVYQVTTFALDTAFVPAIPVFFLRGLDTLRAETFPIVIPVKSLVTEEAEGIRNLAPLAEFPVSIWPWIVGLLLAAGLGYAAYRYMNTRPAPVPEAIPIARPQEAPYAFAMRRLGELQKKANLSDLKTIKPYYVEMSEIIRIYLSRRLRIPAMESTTHELVALLKRRVDAKVIPDDTVGKAQQIFRVMDLVKFADLLPPPHVGQEAMNRTRALIEAIEATLKAAEKPPETPPEPQAAPADAAQDAT